MAEYDSTRALALRLITKRGRADVKLIRVGAGEPADADMPWKPDADTEAADDVELATVHAVFLSPVEARGSAGQFAFPVFERARAEDDDSVATEATHMVYIADAELPDGVSLTERAVGLLVESHGVRYIVLRCQSFGPGEQNILHILSVKG